jgi:23S rRNA (uracil1939-C5)-methyltransferase
VGVEASSFACADFETNLETFDNVELYEASAEQVLGSSGVQQPDFVIADPPRLGLGKEVAAGILALQPRCIAYVSCDPATLARDARQFIEGGYRLAHCTPFDAFPQTYHIESISIFLLT